MRLQLCTLFFITALAAIGQIPKNTFMIGGDGYAYVDRNAYSYVLLNPKFGWFLTKNVAVGVAPNAGLVWVRGFSGSKPLFSLSPSVFGRYYFNTGDRVSVFTQAQAGYRWLFGSNNPSVNPTPLRTDISCGAAIWLTKSIAFEPTLGLPVYSQAEFFPTLLPYLSLGFQIYLRPNGSEWSNRRR